MAVWSALEAWQIAALAGATGVLIGAWLALFVRRRSHRQALRRRIARGQRGEARAAALLEAQGYRVRARHHRHSYRVAVGETEHTVQLIADFIVERAGEELVAEVKTGPSAPSLYDASTRRQMLEYQLATGSHGVLLVDPEAERITEVSFPIPEPSPAPARRSGGLAMVALGLFAAVIWLSWQVWLRTP